MQGTYILPMFPNKNSLNRIVQKGANWETTFKFQLRPLRFSLFSRKFQSHLSNNQKPLKFAELPYQICTRPPIQWSHSHTLSSSCLRVCSYLLRSTSHTRKPNPISMRQNPRTSNLQEIRANHKAVKLEIDISDARESVSLNISEILHPKQYPG